MNFTKKLRRGWNAFLEKENQNGSFELQSGAITSIDPYRRYVYGYRDRSIVDAIINRICIDTSSIEIAHCKVDEKDRFVSKVDSGLNRCLLEEANIDQAGSAFRMDIVQTMCDNGVAAVVPVEASADPRKSDSFDVYSLRVGTVTEWYTDRVRVSVYNEFKGEREEIILPKKSVGIISNPLYSVMNQQNSTLQRLIRKLSLLDFVDEASGSGKLDIIVQLPYDLRSTSMQKRAERRREELEAQLKDSKYGIGYMSATERITQLNRPAENNLLTQIKYLTNLLYDQLGITEEVFNGTASDSVMLNYYNRTITPFVVAITEELNRKFLTKTSRTQGHRVRYMTDPFRSVSVNNIAEMADKFVRNEILTPNEIRSKIGFIPYDDPDADKLRNPNISQPTVEKEKDEM